MATANTEEHLYERDCGHPLFSKQYCVQLISKVVKIDVVVHKFIDSKTISEAERKSLREDKVADQKFRHLLTIITNHCNRDDLQTFKTFIDILGDTGNVDVAQQLSLICNERENAVAILSLLSKEKSLVRNLENEISHLQRMLAEKERCLERFKDAADHKYETFRKEKLSLEKQIKIKDEDLLFVEKEMGELTRKKNDLEHEVKFKSNVIRKREKEIVEKEREVWDAIEESNHLRLKIDTLQQQHSEAMEEDKEMSKKIEILEDELAKKENTIMNLRQNKTMSRQDVEEELGKITKDHEKKLDAQTAMLIKQNEKIEFLTDAVIRALNLQENK